MFIPLSIDKGRALILYPFKRFFGENKKEIQLRIVENCQSLPVKKNDLEVLEIIKHSTCLYFKDIPFDLRTSLVNNKSLKARVLKILKYKQSKVVINQSQEKFTVAYGNVTMENILRCLTDNKITSRPQLYSYNLWLYYFIRNDKKVDLCGRIKEKIPDFDFSSYGIKKKNDLNIREIADYFLDKIIQEQCFESYSFRKIDKKLGQLIIRYKKTDFVKFYIDVKIIINNSLIRTRLCTNKFTHFMASILSTSIKTLA